MPSTVPHFECLEFGIRDKGFPHKHTAQGHRHTPQHTKESPGSINSPKRIELPGPPIRIKGLPRYLDWSITHLTFNHPKLTYQYMLGIHHTFNLIYININILPTFIINPYTMQITFHIKVFFKS